MMKYTGTLTLGMGVILGVPAFTFGGGLPGSLKEALGDTVRAIEVLNQVEQNLEAGDFVPDGAIKTLTEPAILDPRGRDSLLNSLRFEVGTLQAKVDMSEAANIALPPDVELPNGAGAVGPVFPGTVGGAGVFQPIEDMGGADPVDDGIYFADVSTGMSTALRASISAGSDSSAQSNAATGAGAQALVSTGPDTSGGATPMSADATASSIASTQNEAGAEVETTTPEFQSPEGKGYSANPLLQARACFRAKRYQQGLDLLVGAPKGAEVTFLKAQLETKLGNLNEAISLYTLLKEDAESASFAAKAADELAFLVWRRDYEQKGAKGNTK